MEDIESVKYTIKKLSTRNFSGAIEECEGLLDPRSPIVNELMIIEAQYKEAKREYDKNQIIREAYQSEINKLKSAFLELMDRIIVTDTRRSTANLVAINREKLVSIESHLALTALSDLFLSSYDPIWKWSEAKGQESTYFGTAAGKYASQIWRSYNTIRVFGMSNHVPLQSVFVRVNILEKSQDKYKDSLAFLHENYDPKTREVKFGKQRTTKTGIATINSLDKMIVLGKPGAGKSTYLKFLALQSVNKKSGIKQRKLPIFISLKEWADENDTLIEHILKQFTICSLEDSLTLVGNLLDKGRCLLLLDGLDEVQEDRKDDIIEEIIGFSEQYHQNQFVVSCRVAAYNSWFEQFVDVEMADFNDKQIESFINKWFIEEPKLGEKCWSKLKDEAPLKELASTPLLLTLLCIAYDENLDFHASRAELYEEAINALLKKWDSSRRIKRFEPYKNLSLSRKRALFSRIAAQTFEEGKYFFRKKEIVQYIVNYIRNLPNINPSELEYVGEYIFDAIAANHGIFIPRAKGIYSFAHLTFQEYFTARYISENSTKGSSLALIENHIEDNKWREVFLLTTSMLDKADQFLLQIHEQANLVFKKAPDIDVYFKPLDQFLRKNSSNSFSLAARKMSALYVLIVYTRSRSRDFAGDLASALNHARPLALALAGVGALNIDLAIALTLDGNFNSAVPHILGLDHEHVLALDRALALDLNLARALALNLAGDRACDLVRARELSRFLQIKLRLAECLHTECYVSSETRQWLIDNLLVLTEKKRSSGSYRV